MTNDSRNNVCWRHHDSLSKYQNGKEKKLEISSNLCLSNEFHQTFGEISILECFTNAPLTLEALDTPRMK